ncbi:MAG: protein BatD [Gammaproteobacteria bacterium]|nr:MAG: protein BatD [Gammaproteobacteria bacterium]
MAAARAGRPGWPVAAQVPARISAPPARRAGGRTMSRIKLRGFSALAGFAALWICANVYAAQVRAWLDRNTMQLGETVMLNVEVSDDSNAAQPDFSALQTDFNLLGTQSSTAMNIINGQASSKLLWAVGLEPKHAGAITIPALSVAGTQTQSINLVVQPGSGSGGKAGDDIAVRATAGACHGQAVLCTQPDRRQSGRPAW